ncbi:MAG: hypothetical protein NTW03_13385 [Verrucomicrobia bacterium]|nr:hypothetical protein [Verrucomicrobiota bacterium]
MDLTKLNFWKRQQPGVVLGLALDGNRLEGVVVRRTNGSVQLRQSFSVALTLDPLTNDPELVGREIRNQLDAADVRERRCVVSLPSKWALVTHTKLPDLPEADLASFIQIEAERAFPCDVATLCLAVSRFKSASGEEHATMVGIARPQVLLLEKVLRAAQLNPVSFTLGITALQPAAASTSNGVLALVIGESNVGLQVTYAGGVAALRALEGALETESGQPDLVAREARITLGQLPAEIREAVRQVRIFGERELAQELAKEITLRFEAARLEVEVVTAYSRGEFSVQSPPAAAVSPAFSVAVRRFWSFCPQKSRPGSNSSTAILPARSSARAWRWAPPRCWPAVFSSFNKASFGGSAPAGPRWNRKCANSKPSRRTSGSTTPGSRSRCAVSTSCGK